MKCVRKEPSGNEGGAKNRVKMALCRLRTSFICLRKPFIDASGQLSVVLFQPKRTEERTFGPRGGSASLRGPCVGLKGLCVGLGSLCAGLSAPSFGLESPSAGSKEFCVDADMISHLSIDRGPSVDLREHCAAPGADFTLRAPGGGN